MNLRNTKTDGISNKLKEIFQPILDEFEDLIVENNDKKSFMSGLVKIFTILLTTSAVVLAR